MKQTRIFVDLDNTANDWWQYLLLHVRDEFGVAVDFEDEDQFRDYRIQKMIPGPASDAEKRLMASEICSRSAFWKTIPVKSGFRDVMGWLQLREDVDLQVATGLWWSSLDQSILGKQLWLREHLPWLPGHQVTFTGRRDCLLGDWLIDDRPRNLEAFSGRAIAFDQPYNREVDVEYRAHDWREVRSILETELGDV